MIFISDRNGFKLNLIMIANKYYEADQTAKLISEAELVTGVIETDLLSVANQMISGVVLLVVAIALSFAYPLLGLPLAVFFSYGLFKCQNHANARTRHRLGLMSLTKADSDYIMSYDYKNKNVAEDFIKEGFTLNQLNALTGQE